MSKENCDFCRMIGSGEVKKLFEDEKIVAILSPTPAVAGHTLVMPKEHYAILEQAPDFIVGHIFSVVNKISSSLFESVGAQGTNIVVSNGIAAGQKSAHLMVHVLPRKPNDGVNFNWQPKQLGEEEMSTIELQMKEECTKIGDFEAEKAPAIEMDKKRDTMLEEEENYLIKQLDRMP